MALHPVEDEIIGARHFIGDQIPQRDKSPVAACIFTAEWNYNTQETSPDSGAVEFPLT